ncbi:MAG: lipoate--protein ligase family protein [Ignavibacteriae bacterium]|nr:lipoate--protein ligase family protein [Ignavibacteria bacterium]MBI3365414.1 lipoate--protein ligase family protein [Ignavibacteriota bacterium]
MWKFLNTGFHSGSFNMEFDEALAGQFDSSRDDALLRIYGWKPYAISLGIHQRMEDFDLQRLSDEGIDIVRRPTGGRAILHAHELTYSIVMSAGDRGVREVYRYIGRGLLEGLNILGISAQLSEDDERLTTPLSNPASIPCFSSSAKCEIRFEGKKIVGSAQRRYGTIILQHGSFLLGTEHKRITEFLAQHVQSARSVLEDHLEQRTIEAETILERAVTFDEAAACIRNGFERAWNMTFTESSLTHTIV